MANEVTVAHVQAAKELTVELIRRQRPLPTAFQDKAKACAKAYKTIYRAVVKPLED